VGNARRHTALRNQLVQARKGAELTQVQLAKRLRKPQSYVSKYENGERRLDVAEFIEVCRAIGIEPSALVAELKEIS
jgi:transcriptional regulator with XRE-family HTH domain